MKWSRVAGRSVVSCRIGVVGAMFAFGCSSPDSGGSNSVSVGGGAAAGGASGAGGSEVVDTGLGGGSAAGGQRGNLDGTQDREQQQNTEGCVAEVARGETVPVDMFIMMDRSGSMLGGSGGLFGGTPSPNVWIPIGQALGTFVTLPEATGLGVGIQFFPIQNESCDPNVYAQPAAAIAKLPGNTQAIQQAIVGNEPQSGGSTPTRPAMEGALQHATLWAQQNPGTKTIVVLATDGEPNICNSDVPSVAAIAQRGATQSPPIETYVVGIGNVAGLNQIAAAGDPAGVRQAQIVSTDPAVASQQFLDAMNQIRGDATLPCEFQIPPPPEGEELNFERVNVTFSQGTSASELFFVGDQSGCDPTDGGWHYDDAANPTKVLICEATCNVLTTLTDGQIDIELGCGRRDRIPR